MNTPSIFTFPMVRKLSKREKLKLRAKKQVQAARFTRQRFVSEFRRNIHNSLITLAMKFK